MLEFDPLRESTDKSQMVRTYLVQYKSLVFHVICHHQFSLHFLCQFYSLAEVSFMVLCLDSAKFFSAVNLAECPGQHICYKIQSPEYLVQFVRCLLLLTQQPPMVFTKPPWSFRHPLDNHRLSCFGCRKATVQKKWLCGI